MGRIYERKYQKDVHESLSALDPIVGFADNVFDELFNQQEKMKKSIQNSFMMAYAETKHLEYVSKQDGPDLQKTLNFISKIQSNPSNSIPDLLFHTTSELKKYGFYEKESMKFSDSLYALVTAKRKLERELDWTICSLDKSALPLLRKMCVPQKLSTNNDDENNVLISYHDSVGIIDHLHKKIRDFTNNSQWQSSQTLSLLLKKNSKTSDALFLDSKAIPDANDLDKVLAIPRQFTGDKITVKKLAKKMNVQPRMAMYYLDSAEMLGLIRRVTNHYVPTELVFKLDKYPIRDKPEIIRGLIYELPVVKAFKLYLENISKTRFTTRDISKFLEYSTDLSKSTAKRRASTIYAWLSYGKSKNQHNISDINTDSEQTQMSEFIEKFSNT